MSRPFPANRPQRIKDQRETIVPVPPPLDIVRDEEAERKAAQELMVNDPRTRAGILAQKVLAYRNNLRGFEDRTLMTEAAEFIVFTANEKTEAQDALAHALRRIHALETEIKDLTTTIEFDVESVLADARPASRWTRFVQFITNPLKVN